MIDNYLKLFYNKKCKIINCKKGKEEAWVYHANKK